MMTSTATADNFRIVNNVNLDSSMNSTQGLLSFMTNASRQIKTYLGPDQQQKANQVRIEKALKFINSFFFGYHYEQQKIKGIASSFEEKPFFNKGIYLSNTKISKKNCTHQIFN